MLQQGCIDAAHVGYRHFLGAVGQQTLLGPQDGLCERLGLGRLHAVGGQSLERKDLLQQGIEAVHGLGGGATQFPAQELLQVCQARDLLLFVMAQHTGKDGVVGLPVRDMERGAQRIAHGMHGGASCRTKGKPGIGARQQEVAKAGAQAVPAVQGHVRVAGQDEPDGFRGEHAGKGAAVDR